MSVKEPALIPVDISLIGAEVQRDKGLLKGRRCECCNAPLASDNKDKLCRPCDKAINTWQLFPHLRREMNLSEHCRTYIESRSARRRREIDEGVSSGSWARVMGKDMSRKKEE